MIEYKIIWKQPADYNPSKILQQLPSPISRDMKEIYNYSIEDDKFIIKDRNIDPSIVGYVFKLFIDEALNYTDSIEIKTN